MLYILFTVNLLKNPSFYVKYFKRKSPSAMPKGWKWSGSPDRTTFATFA